MGIQFDSTVENFYKSPREYLLYIEDGEKKTLKAEREGCRTWIKANLLNPSAYKLHTITAELQNDPPLLTKGWAVLLLAKISKYNVNHAENPISKCFFQNFIKEREVFPIHNEDVIYHFVLEHLRALTPETAPLPRAPLIPTLMTKLQDRNPPIELPKEEVRRIAIQTYFYIAACNFNLGRKIPLDPETEADDMTEYLTSLRQAVKIDFNDTYLLTQPSVINAYGIRAFKNIWTEHTENFISRQ